MSDLNEQLTRLVPDWMVERWRIVAPALSPALRQWIEAGARRLLDTRLPYPLQQRLDRAIGEKPAQPRVRSPEAPPSSEDAMLRQLVLIQARADREIEQAAAQVHNLQQQTAPRSKAPLARARTSLPSPAIRF